MTLTAQKTQAAVTAEITLKPLPDLGEADGVIGEEGGSPVLLGGQCARCGKRSFPLRTFCPYCAAGDMKTVAIGSEGTLYSYTTVHVSSTRPTPYTIGYVDLDQNVRTLSLIGGDTASLTPDMTVRLIVEDGGWFFAPPRNSEGAAA